MIGWAVETFVATTALMLVVLAIRAPVRKAFGPHMAYALWLLPVIRLVMPPLPGDWHLSRLLAPLARQAEDAPGIAVGVMNPATLPPELAGDAIVTQVELAGHAANVALVPPTTVAGGPSLLVLALGVWAIGALLFLGYHLIAHRRFCVALLRRARVDRTVAQGRVRVIETDAAHGPLAFGIFRKYVAFPRDFAERYDELERDLALAHELGHHVRGDLIANWVALVVLALHWFNPVAWRAFRAFRADQEMACDALVLAGRAQALRHAYGRAIVKSAHGGAVSAACHLHTINEVKGRLRMLSKTTKTSPRRVAAGLVGMSALSLAALGLTASGTQAAAEIRTSVGKGVSALAQDLPAPPAAPSAPAAASAPEAPDPALAPVVPAAPAAHGVRSISTTTTTTTDKDGKRIKKIVMVRADGGKTEFAMPDEAAIKASIPEVRGGNCGPGTATVEHRTVNGRDVMTVCSDRIEIIAANAEASAARSKALGLRTAIASLHSARASIANEKSLTAEARAEALAGIDEAIAEVRSQQSEKD
ncbi:M56 family metallopeptidase [Sphingomonas sp. CJ20]